MKALLVLMLLAAAPALAQDYADDGPLTVGVTTGTVTVQTTQFTYDLYSPATGGPWPIIALGHGFSNSKAAMQGLARALSSRGNFVVVPQFPFLDSNHSRNGAAMLGAIDAVAAAQPTRADASRQAVAGHSAGGLSAMFGAISRPTLRAVVELDGVDGNPALTSSQLSAVRSPVLLLSAPPSMCNSQNNSAAWYASLSAVPRGRFRVTSALHCDPTEPTDSTCTFGCPGTDAQRTRRFKRAAVAWLQYFVSCDVAARTSIDGAEFQASKSSGLVGADQFDALPASPCVAPDAGAGGGTGGGGGAAGGTAGGAAGGTAGGAAGGTSGGAAGGAAGGAGGGAAGGAGGGDDTSRGCGCDSGAPLASALLGIGAMLRRRRWRR